jgi:lysyl-tRNA synthetase class 2
MRDMGIDPYPAAEYVVTGYSTEIKAGFRDEEEPTPALPKGKE